MSDRDVGAGGLRVAVLTRAVTPLHGVGGLERSTFDLVRHLLARGTRIELFTRPATSHEVWKHERLAFHVVPYRTFPGAGRKGTTIIDRSTAYPLFGYRLGRAAAAMAAAGEVDIVYGLGASALGYAAARRRAPDRTVPLVLNPQGLEEFGGVDGSYGGRPSKRIGYEPLRRAVRYCADAADRVIATDHALEPMLAAALGVGADRLRLVPNAVDLPACDALAAPRDGIRVRDQYGLGRDQVVLLSVARLERNKGLHVLAEALGSLTALPWTWVVVGDGPFRRALEDRVTRLGLGGRTILTGRLQDGALHAWYEAASLFVHPTLYEGSSLVTLEAMAHRRPVVATTAGGLPDKVRDGVSGWLVPPGDAPALARAVRMAIGAGGTLATMGRAGRALVEAEFSWDRSADRMLAVFRELLGGVTIA